jgi:hypothetical protein
MAPRRPIHWLLVLLALLTLAGPTRAEPQAPAISVTYLGSFAGAAIVQLSGRLDRTDQGYTLRLGGTTVGAAAVIAHGRQDVISQGVWRGDGAMPTHVDSEGIWNGKIRRMIVDFPGGMPIIRIMLPADHERRRAVDRDAIAGTTDGLTVLVGLIRQVAATGKCDMRARVFDGHGVTAFAMTTAAPAAATPLRCDFTTRKVAGLEADDDPKRVGHGYVLFAAPSPALPKLPVKLVFRVGWMGDAVLSLTEAHLGG